MILALVAFTMIVFSPSPTPLDATDSPDQATSQPLPRQDLYSVLTDAGERFIGGQPLNITPVVVPELVNEPAVPDENETSLDEEDVAVVPDYDDDELFGLIENSSTSLMLLAVKVSHALYSWDERSVAVNAASLQAFAKETLRNAERLEVSEDRETMKAAFTSSLRAYVAASEAVQENNPLNTTRVDTALGGIQQGSIHLREAFEGLDHPVLHVPQEILEVDFSGSRTRTATDTGEELVLLQRYLYEDRYRANDISIMLAAATKVSTYWQYNEKTEMVVADQGRTFLLVEVRATNLGHKGDSRVYRIQTPAISAFTLHYRDNTYSPVKLTPRTSLGESYGAATLDRYEKKSGYIAFDVPEALSLNECYVQVNLGEGESPVWSLGKTL
ncbi:MAG: hypothetical protein WC993_04400 [Methanoculleus sp.]